MSLVAAARTEPETPDTERRLVEVVHQLLSDATVAEASTDLTRRVLAASMTALDAASVRLATADDEVLADWRRPGLPRRGHGLTTMSSSLPDGSELTVTWDGPATITRAGLDVVADLLGMVEERTAADRHAARRLRQQRRAWGQEIHDGITQSVTAAVMMLERAKSMTGDASVAPLVEEAQEEIRASLRALRDVLAQVVDDDRDADSGEQSLTELVDDLRARWRLQVKVTVRGHLTGVATEAASVARAVVREVLTNVAKHATATHVQIRVTHRADVVAVDVVDDGGEPLSLGLLVDRVARVGGRVRVDTEPGTATTVALVLPRRTPSGR